jgi:hypothetical protein
MIRSHHLFLLVLLLVASTCSSNVQRCRTDKALLEDNFNDTACGWDQYDRKDASAGYSGSEYSMVVHQINTSAVSVVGAEWDNVLLQVDARLADGSSDNNHGLLCRYRDLNHFYAFLVSSDGYYAIVKVIGASPFLVLSGDGTYLLPSEAIQTGPDAVNEIRALCDGDQLALYVNGQQLASVSDTDLTSGDVGFLVSTYSDGATEIRFDNLLAWEVSGPGQEAK